MYWVGCLLPSHREYQENLICDDLAGQGFKISNFCFKYDNTLLVTSWIWVIHISLRAGIIKNRSFSVIFFQQIYLCYFWSECHRKAIRMYILWATTLGKTLTGWEAGLWAHLWGEAGHMRKGGGRQGERRRKEVWTLAKQNTTTDAENWKRILASRLYHQKNSKVLTQYHSLSYSTECLNVIC